jgi:hypothetical protein
MKATYLLAAVVSMTGFAQAQKAPALRDRGLLKK